jgi:glycosyltransferase involved in cell wall biosynthesis
MSDSLADLAICIPTFRRARLLCRLLDDLSRQSITAGRLIVVDGDPPSGGVDEALASSAPAPGAELLYVPSNHANLPYQRFLGWKAAAGAKWLLYLDDDMRLLHPDSIERLLRPLQAPHGKVVGATAEFVLPRARPDAGNLPDADKPRSRAGALAGFVRRLGSSRRIPAGALSPSGHRRPLVGRGKPYEVVGCLRGGAMAFRMSAVTPECFSDALFAMYQRGCGRGEDMLLSRRVGSRGILLSALGAGVVHPEGHPTVAYRRDGFSRGYATAYSRRLLNDHYRGHETATWTDRLALANSYAGHAALAWFRGLQHRDRQALAFAWGYSLGALRGLLQRPTSRALTPEINWWADAEAALARARTLAPAHSGVAWPLASPWLP